MLYIPSLLCPDTGLTTIAGHTATIKNGAKRSKRDKLPQALTQLSPGAEMDAAATGAGENPRKWRKYNRKEECQQSDSSRTRHPILTRSSPFPVPNERWKTLPHGLFSTPISAIPVPRSFLSRNNHRQCILQRLQYLTHELLVAHVLAKSQPFNHE